MKVKNMVSNNGNFVPNQFIVWDDESIIFQSYNSIIAKKSEGKIYLDEYYWNYSRTTSKYRSQFLGENTAETEKKIKAGVYVLTNLN